MDRFESHTAFRESIVCDLKRQLFGPDDMQSEISDAEVLSVSPLQLYATGVLFPQKMHQELIESGGDDAAGIDDTIADDDLPEGSLREGRGRGRDSDEGSSSSEREPLNLANEFSPSASGISFRLNGPTDLSVKVGFATYETVQTTEPHPRAGQISMNGQPYPATRTATAYKRIPNVRTIPLKVMGRGILPPVEIEGAGGALKLHVTIRGRTDGTMIVSTMVVNHRTASAGLPPALSDVFFQVSLEVSESSGSAVFLPIDRDVDGSTDDEELASIELLYRHRRAFALGHGGAGDWNRDERLSERGVTNLVKLSVIPTYDLKPIKPREKGFNETDLQLSMRFFYDADGKSEPELEIISALEALARDYDAWIRSTEAQSASIGIDRLAAAAKKNLEACRRCHARMIRGIDILKSNRTAMLAFRLMNKAMLVQQFHSDQLKFRELGSPFPEIPTDYLNLPGGDRRWRPFQLAFILMNLAGMSIPDDPERKLVDLIWFPTGGGKTEAYLGLAAYTICYERLGGAPPGVTVLMRYTLRLLTAQQFQRAAALVLALEALRQDRELGANLGDAEISIGLWVGQSLTPNTREDARHQLNRLKRETYAQNPFQVLQCPWCGVDFTNKAKLGYQDVRISGSTQRRVKFVCSDDACRFGARSGGLPIQVVDEEIYDTPPTILIGTVDKFAQIAWEDRVGRLFGLQIGAAPPALVIQDELHLISGPLGTIVGLYETAIDRLCSRDGHIHKIVASTATIRRASEQCRSLYSRDAFEFPPQAIRAGESYFAFEDTDSAGRLYVGVLGSAVKSHQTSLVRTCAPLLQSVCQPVEVQNDEKKRSIIDPYGTLVWYFNSLRELGHAATLCMGDIPEFLKGLCHRLSIPYEERRYIKEVIELTSRRNAEEIPEILQQLETPWRQRPIGKPSVDVLLATNMIAVGVDVARLGLIVMSGQPKSTSEYIQATSRVGRRFPGLVVTVYTQSKSRDRSHYERFVAYHQSLYRYVEPTSVTPFSPQARDRGMRGVLIALARQVAGVSDPSKIKEHENELLDEVDRILSRVEYIDEGEAVEARSEIDEWLGFWKKYSPPRYGRMGGSPSELTLAYPFGSPPDPHFQRDAWPVLTSMRNVDGTSRATVLTVYQGQPEDQN